MTDGRSVQAAQGSEPFTRFEPTSGPKSPVPSQILSGRIAPVSRAQATTVRVRIKAWGVRRIAAGEDRATVKAEVDEMIACCGVDR